MPLINQSAKRLRVWVSDSVGNRPSGYSGTGPIEITELVRSLKLGDKELDIFSSSGSELEGGTVPVDGVLAIAGNPPIGSTFSNADLETRSNALWATGNRIDVQVQLDDGSTYAPFPRGALRILKRPNPPRRIRPETEIQVGCDLTWLNRDNAPESNSDITLDPAGDNPTTVINLLAARVGLPSLVDSISTPLIRKIPPRQSGTRVDQIGGILLPLLRWAWVDGDRSLRAQLLNLEASPDFTLNTTLDASEWDTEIGAIPEPEEVRIRTTRRITVTRTSPTPKPSEETENTEVETTVDDPFGDSEFTTTVIRSRGELFPRQYPLGDSTPITASVAKTIHTYSGNLLTRKVERASGLKGVILPDAFPGDETVVAIASRTTIDYTIASDGYLEKVAEKTEELIGTFDTVATPQDGLVVTRIKITTWEPYPSAKGWLEKTVTSDLRERKPAVTSINLVESPPLPETKPQEEEDIEVPDEGTADLEGALPKRPLYLKLRFSTYAEGQANDIAGLMGKLRWAASLPATWDVPIFDGLITGYKPFLIWDWVDIDGVTYRYLSHAHSFEFTQERAIASMQGLCLGKVVGGVLEPTWTFSA